MLTHKYFSAVAFGAILLAQIALPAMAATAPADPITITVTADAIASGTATAPLPTSNTVNPAANRATGPAGNAAVPSAAAKPGATPPAVAPARDNSNTFLGLFFIVGVLSVIYLLNKKKAKRLGNGNERVYYGDPEDYPRPRGRMLNSRERAELRQEYRRDPLLDESSLDNLVVEPRRQTQPQIGTQPVNEADAMKPRYTRQSQAALILPTAQNKKTFADVAGQPEAIARLGEICAWLKQPEIYNRHNAKLPRGILLVGPPGTGKTLCAEALAGETHGSMFSIAASTFVEMYVGVGAGRVRDLFADARAQRRQTKKPVIIFIDELDAVGGARGKSANSNSEREQTLNQLLVEMDGFEKNEGIIVVAATNRPDMLDAALRRKGRFDVEVHVDLPDVNGRKAIILVHTRDKVVDTSVDFDLMARRTFGMSGADLAAAANEAAMLAAREQARLEALEREKLTTETKAAETKTASNQAALSLANAENNASQASADKAAHESPENTPQPAAEAAAPSVMGKVTAITNAMFDEAISIVESGDARRERFQSMSAQDKKQTAYHELGHAVVIHKTGGDPITKITILPRGRALGYVQTHTEADRWNMTEEQMRKRITSAMAGRIAQEILMQTVDTGAASDFEQANLLARKMVTQYGMSPLGAIFIPENGLPIGPTLTDKIDVETSKILGECGAEARKIIEASRHQIEALVNLLLEKETIFGDHFVAVLEASQKSAQESAPKSEGDE